MPVCVKCDLPSTYNVVYQNCSVSCKRQKKAVTVNPRIVAGSRINAGSQIQAVSHAYRGNVSNDDVIHSAHITLS